MQKLLIAVLLLAVTNAIAADKKSLALQDAVKTALENSNNIKLSKAKVDLAKAKYNQLIDATLPSLKVSGGYTRQSDIEELKFQTPGSSEPVVLYPNIPNVYTTRASLTETIFSGFRLKYAQQSQKFLQQAVELDAQKDSDEVIFNVVNAYFNIYKIKQSQAVVDQTLEHVKQHVKDVQSWEKNGIVTHNEVLKWQLQQTNMELAKLDLQNNLQIALYNLSLMIGLDDEVTNIDTNLIFTSRALSSEEDYMKSAGSMRSDLMAMDLRYKATSNSLKVAKNGFYPNIAVGANYVYARPNQRIFPLRDLWKETWDAGITLTWDITNLYSNRHNIDEARANQSQAEAQKEILSDAIKMEINQNYLMYDEANKKTDVFAVSVAQAHENYRITENKYKNQLVLQSELLDADNALLQSKINLINSKADAEVAYYRLLKSSGGNALSQSIFKK